MNDNFDIKTTEEILNNLFARQNKDDFSTALNITKKWDEIVRTIKEKNFDRVEYNAGEKIASHSKIVDLKNGILLIETDHPGWIQKIQFHQKYIITGLKRAFPQLEINTLTFKLKGDKNFLHDFAQEKNENKKETDVTENEPIEDINIDEKNFAPELAAVLNDLKNSILTKK